MNIVKKVNKNKLLSIYMNVVETDEAIHIIHPLIRNIKSHINKIDLTENSIIIIKFLQNRRAFLIEQADMTTAAEKKKLVDSNSGIAAVIEIKENKSDINIELYEI